MPRERPGDKFGTSQGHPGRLGRFMWKCTFKGQNVRGTDGTDDGTDGTCPRDRRDTNQGGIPPKFFMCIGFFPHFGACVFWCGFLLHLHGGSQRKWTINSDHLWIPQQFLKDVLLALAFLRLSKEKA